MQERGQTRRVTLQTEGRCRIGLYSLETNKCIKPETDDMMLKYRVQTMVSKGERDEWSTGPKKKKWEQSPLCRAIFVCGNGDE